MSKLYHENGERVVWNYGGRKSVLETYVKLHERKIGCHWLWAAMERIVAGEDELSVMADYGYVRDV